VRGRRARFTSGGAPSGPEVDEAAHPDEERRSHRIERSIRRLIGRSGDEPAPLRSAGREGLQKVDGAGPRSPLPRWTSEGADVVEAARARAPSSPRPRKTRSFVREVSQRGDIEDELESEHLQERISVTRSMQRRLREFDRRWVSEGGVEKRSPVSGDARRTTLRAIVAASMQKRAEESRRSQACVDSEDDLQQAELQTSFAVVRWSSQAEAAPAVNLQEAVGGSGKLWETSPGKIRHEFLTMELDTPLHISSIEIGIPSASSAPRRCRVQYCRTSAAGPWHDLWRFEVTTPNSRTFFRGEGNHGRSLREFVSSLLQCCEDEAAASALLDVREDGLTTLPALQSVCHSLSRGRCECGLAPGLPRYGRRPERGSQHRPAA